MVMARSAKPLYVGSSPIYPSSKLTPTVGRWDLITSGDVPALQMTHNVGFHCDYVTQQIHESRWANENK
jgi:hypothetical protein